MYLPERRVRDPAAMQNFEEIRRFLETLASPGTVKLYVGSTAETGWLKCDGSSYSTDKYPELAKALGAVGSTFNVPTYTAVSGTPTAKYYIHI